MALYHKWDVKNDFTYVLTFFSLISDSLGSVYNLQLLYACMQCLMYTILTGNISESGSRPAPSNVWTSCKISRKSKLLCRKPFWFWFLKDIHTKHKLISLRKFDILQLPRLRNTLIHDLVSVVTCPNIYMGFVLVHFHKY